MIHDDVVLDEGVIAGIPVRTVLRDGEIVLCLASHAVEIPIPVADAAALGVLMNLSVERALLAGARARAESTR